jgi:hypothetical protein
MEPLKLHYRMIYTIIKSKAFTKEKIKNTIIARYNKIILNVDLSPAYLQIIKFVVNIHL